MNYCCSDDCAVYSIVSALTFTHSLGGSTGIVSVFLLSAIIRHSSCNHHMNIITSKSVRFRYLYHYVTIVYNVTISAAILGIPRPVYKVV